MNSLLTAAFHYAKLGYSIFPCKPGGKTPITDHGVLDATTDTETIEWWWAKTQNANIGLSTMGLIAIDIDGKNNPWPPVGVELGGAISITPHGRHHIFKQPDNDNLKNTTGRIAPHVDTRANGGYIIVAPSVVNGIQYQWAETFELDCSREHLLEIPKFIKLNNNGKSTPALQSENPIPSGQRNSTLASLAGTMNRAGMGQSEILAAITQTNIKRCVPPLTDSEVNKIASSISRYEPDQNTVGRVEHHYEQDRAKSPALLPEPKPLPAAFYRIPGFISEVMDYSLETAPYPNTIMAFGGALSLLAMLTGRKIRDSSDNRTNIYLVGLANSSSGKDRPRKVNVEILHAIGLSNCIGGHLVSGEGIQDALFANSCMLFQTDEFDGIFQSITKSKDARYESIVSTFLTMYSSANTIFPMRSRANSASVGTINQPCLVIFGTAIPSQYYKSLSERLITNGLFARIIIIECGNRSLGQEPKVLAPPPRILAVSKYWADFRPSNGNLENENPTPIIIPHSDEAKSLLIETRLESEEKYKCAEKSKDDVGISVWGRVNENIHKLSLLYAASENYKDPLIGKKAVGWARKFMFFQAQRMLFMAHSHVSDNPFDADCLKTLEKLRNAQEQILSHSVLLKRMKMESRKFLEIISTLDQRGDIEIRKESTTGRPGRFYKMYTSIPPPPDGVKEGGERR